MSYYELLQESPGLFVLTIIISLVVTLIAYGAFPLVFSRTRKSNITKKKYYTLCYCINFAVMVLFIAINGEPSSGGPYLLWTWVFSSSGLKTLKGRGILGESQIVSCPTSPSNEESIIADTPIAGDHQKCNTCQNCGHELINGASFCNMCGTKVPSVDLLSHTNPINHAVNDKICFCRKCGNKLPTDSEFCQYCGSKIEVPIAENNSSNADIKEESFADEVVTPVVENETATKIIASGIAEEQKAMEANRENQPRNELDADFGLVPHKPVYTVGIDEQEKYLKSLRAINGEPIKWNRRGSMSVDSVNGMVDVFDIYLPSGEEYKTIYVNMYGASNSTFAPKGFAYSNQSTSPPIVSTPKYKSKKSKGLKIVLMATGILTIVAVLFFVFTMLEINYQRANTLLNENKYNDARLAFIDLGNYRDSEYMVDECIYQEACSLISKISINRDNYRSAKNTAKEAISLFEGLNGYKNSKDKINEVKYKLVSTHYYFFSDDREIYYRNYDTTIFDYLKELKSENYKNSANLYKKLYDWKVEVVAVNSSENDVKTNQDTIKRNKPIYFHIKLSGGEPNASVRISVKNSFQGENFGNVTFFKEKWVDGNKSSYYWPNGLSSTGILKCYFYDEDENMIGVGSVEIVE